MDSGVVAAPGQPSGLLEDSGSRVKDLFDFYDLDGNGEIQRQELLNVLSTCAKEMSLEVDYHLESIVDAVFGNAKLTPTGSITYESLREVLRQRPNLINELALSLTTTTGKAGARQPDSGRKEKQHEQRGQQPINLWDSMMASLGRCVPICDKLRWDYISNNIVRVNFLMGILLASFFLVAGRIINYWAEHELVILARACGQCLNFFSSFTVLLVCRRSLSFLRSQKIGRYLPIDDHVYFHKIIGHYILAHSLLHTLGHLLNFYRLSSTPESKFTYIDYLFSCKPAIGWVYGLASLTGWILLAILLAMVLAELFSRRLGRFELFYYTHLLYIPFWVALFIHAPRFWMWFVGPFTVFFVEFLIRVKNVSSAYLTAGGQTTIIKGVPLPSNVIHLVIKRPPNFDYNPGDWIYVLIPQIAKYEWHPFTISSAPEQNGVIWLHIRAVGEWTKRLRSYFETIGHRNHLSKFIKSGQFSISIDQYSSHDFVSSSPNPATDSSSARRERFSQFKALQGLGTIPENKTLETVSSIATTCETSLDSSIKDSNVRCGSNLKPKIKILIDGPYGSPSSQIFKAEHAVLIATGIGVTPFASILQSIVMHYEKKQQRCPNCSHEFIDTKPPLEFKLRKVDFVWINRDQKSFEWFIKLLAELELTQSHLKPQERFLDIHIHLTAMAPAQIKSIGLQLALYLVHEKNKKDLVTGLQTRTRVGRPNWDQFFGSIQEQKKGKVSVFFCGRPQLARQLHRQCDHFGFKFRKETF